MEDYDKKTGKKLTWEDACEIRRLYGDGSNTIGELVKKYSVCRKTIKDVITGKTWKLEKKLKLDRGRKLNSDEVQDIRKMYKTGKYLQIDLAKKYDVDPTLISAIIRNVIWKE